MCLLRRRVLVVGGSFSGLAAGRDLGRPERWKRTKRTKQVRARALLSTAGLQMSPNVFFSRSASGILHLWHGI